MDRWREENGAAVAGAMGEGEGEGEGERESRWVKTIVLEAMEALRLGGAGGIDSQRRELQWRS